MSKRHDLKLGFGRFAGFGIVFFWSHETLANSGEDDALPWEPESLRQNLTIAAVITAGRDNSCFWWICSFMQCVSRRM